MSNRPIAITLGILVAIAVLAATLLKRSHDRADFELYAHASYKSATTKAFYEKAFSELKAILAQNGYSPAKAPEWFTDIPNRRFKHPPEFTYFKGITPFTSAYVFVRVNCEWEEYIENSDNLDIAYAYSYLRFPWEASPYKRDPREMWELRNTIHKWWLIESYWIKNQFC